MLKKIIKRDKTIEEFTAGKLNKWMLWSSEEVRSRVDWASIVQKTVKDCDEVMDSQALNERLMRNLIRKKSWPYALMAGRIYNAITRKKMFDDKMPSVRKLQKKLTAMGLMEDMQYTDEEYIAIEAMIDHDKDMHMAQFQIKQIVNKYGISIRTNTRAENFETPQYVFMRMAMKLAQSEPIEKRLEEVKAYYQEISNCIVNAPSPNYSNLGTGHNGLASCCLYTVDDDARSLAIGDHIAYTMTYMSSGIGGYLNTRSLGDDVRGGSIEHQGKFYYYKAQAGAVKANTQGGRGGACTSYFTVFDPEVIKLVMLQNPLTPTDAQIRDIHFAVMWNKLFVKRLLQNKDYFTFNSYTAPDLHEALFSGDEDKFEELYNKYENDPTFVKNYLSARDVGIRIGQQRHETSTLYRANIAEINRHTPFKDPIHSANLCVETVLPTGAYHYMTDLYKDEDVSKITLRSKINGAVQVFKGGDILVDGKLNRRAWEIGHYKDSTVFDVVSTYNPETAICSLAGIVITNIPEGDDAAYERAAYYSLKMADKCIDLSHYELPQVGYTTKRRRSIGVGMLGVALHMARKGLKYDTLEGRNELHRIAERHSYFLIKASLQLGKELGNAEWMYKTKWPEGWLPIDSYKKNVDELVTVGLQYDWETLRAEIIANGGIRHSVVVAHMPTESSSKASGAPNGIYPIRDLNLLKTDANNTLDWVAVDNDLLGDKYQVAWEVDPVGMLQAYAVVQKFTDQAISADEYADRVRKPVIDSDELIEIWKTAAKYGEKSAYYQNSFTLETTKLDDIPASAAKPEVKQISALDAVAEASKKSFEEMLDAAAGDTISVSDVGCAGGVCTL